MDFRESTDLTKDVHAATDGLGPHAAIIAAGDVGSLSKYDFYIMLTLHPGAAIQPSSHVSSHDWNTGRSWLTGRKRHT